MLKISKLLSGTSHFSPQAIDTVAHNLVFKNGLTAEQVAGGDLLQIYAKALPKNLEAIFLDLSEDQQFLILENFKAACEDALYEFQYSAFEVDDDGDAPDLKGFKF
jgi:hypothetical protein